MASLLVKLHEVIEDYMRKSNNKKQAELIGSGVLEAARDVIKTNLFDPLKSLEFASVKPMRILTREVKRINMILVRRMKPTPTFKCPWKLSLSRYMPGEIFCILDKLIQGSNFQSSCSKTRFTHRIIISNGEKLTDLFLQLANVYEDDHEKSVKEDQLLQTKILREGQKCKVLVSEDKPFTISYSVKREIMKMSLHYGCWNIHGIPQHSL